MNIKTEIENLKNKFLIYLEEELDRSPKTLENYDRYLKKFIVCTKVQTPRDIDIKKVETFKKWLTERPIFHKTDETSNETLHEKTQNYQLIALRAFLKYLHKENISSLDPKEIKLVQYVQNVPQSLETKDVELLLESFVKNDIKSLRDKAICLVLLNTGVRVSELCNLNKDDVLDNHVIVQGKKGSKRKIFLPNDVKEVIDEYIQRRRDSDKALFVNNGKRTSLDNTIRLTPRSVQRIVRQCAVNAGITHQVTPHSLRHSFAQALFREGKSKGEIRALLGYEDSVSISK